MDPKAATFNRILVALDTSWQSYAALETAAEFASHLQAELMALFIEDADLLRLAELPFAKELDRSSGVMRPLDAGALIRALQADAQRLQNRLAEESEKRRISVSMKVVRGQYVAAAMEMADQTDIVFLYDVAALSYGATSTKAGAARTGRVPIGQKPVWVFYNRSASSQRSLSLALSLSRKYNANLIVVMTEDAAGDKLDAQVGNMLRSHPGLWCRLLSLSDKESLSNAVKLKGCSVLVLPRDMEADETEAGLFFSQIRCPRILV